MTLKAWIARDGDGEFALYFGDPTWEAENDWFVGNEMPGLMCPDSLCEAFPIEPRHKLAIELAVTPLGVAVPGGAT